MLKTRKFLFCALATLTFAGCVHIRFYTIGSSGELKSAEEYSRQGNYDEAIAAYRRHMEDRLSVTNRPSWENPYFYLILIGDIQLGQGKPEQALESFKEADARGVDQYLVADRIRETASWYEKQNRLDDAIKLLSTCREKDPLMFDSMLDRLSKELVRREDGGR